MPLKVGMRPNGSSIAYSTGAAFSLGLDSIPFSLLELYLDVACDLTTTTTGAYDDFYDRMITDMSLNKGGITYVAFSNMRIGYHYTRLQGMGLRRPISMAGSQTAVTVHFGYLFHFGTKPWYTGADGRLHWNHWDLSGGIPPAGKGDLVLSGHWAANTAMGSGCTTQTASTITPYFIGLGQLPGEADSAYMPRAFPAWQQFNYNGDVGSISSAKATREDIPIGDFLHSALVMTRSGAAPNDVRSDAILTDWQLWDTVGSRDIWSVNAWIAGTVYQQGKYNGWPPAENDGTTAGNAGTLGTPSLNQLADQGLLWFDFQDLASKGDPDYGIDMTRIQKSTLQWRFGVASSTNAALDVLYAKYVKNASLVQPAVGATPQGTAIGAPAARVMLPVGR